MRAHNSNGRGSVDQAARGPRILAKTLLAFLCLPGLLPQPVVAQSAGVPVGVCHNQPASAVEIIITADRTVHIRAEGGSSRLVGNADLIPTLGELTCGEKHTLILIRADRALNVQALVDVMGALRNGGYDRVSIVVRQPESSGD